MKLVIGITGGIGSGKSAVTDRFEALDIVVVDADKASRVIVEPGGPALDAIADHFGKEILLDDGHLDRAALRGIVFANDDQRRWLEQLTHPLIAQEIRRQLESATSPYVILASPLLLETTQSTLVDLIVVVDAPEAIQLQRTMARDANDEAQVKRIIAAQAPRDTRLERADIVIDNSGSLTDLDTVVAELHKEFLARAEGREV